MQKVLSFLKKLISERKTRIPSVLFLGLIYGLLVTRAGDYPLLLLFVIIIFLGTPIILYLYANEGLGATGLKSTKNQKLIRLLKYFIPFMIAGSIGSGIGGSLLYSPEERAERERLEIAEKERKEQAELKAKKQAIEERNKVLRTYNYQIPIWKFANEFEDNKLVSLDKYKGKRTYLRSGQVHSIEENPINKNKIVINIREQNLNMFWDGSGMSYYPPDVILSCSIRRSNKIYTKMKKGQVVSFIGELVSEGFVFNFRNCWFQIEKVQGFKIP